MHRARNNQHANRAATSSNADRSANLDHLAGAALVGSLTTWRLALMRKPQPHSSCCGRPTNGRAAAGGRGRSVGSFGLVGAPRSRASFVIVAPQRQATSTCKVTAAQVRKRAEEDTFIWRIGGRGRAARRSRSSGRRRNGGAPRPPRPRRRPRPHGGGSPPTWRRGGLYQQARGRSSAGSPLARPQGSAAKTRKTPNQQSCH